MESLPAANVLPFIEAHFAYLVAEHGFALVQSTEIPSMAWFKRDDRVVIVAFDCLRDAAIEIDLVDGATDERYRLADVLAFEPNLPPVYVEGMRDRVLVVSELARLAGVVANFAATFLVGDLDAFRRRYREALLVRGTRAAAIREFYDGDPVRARALFESLRAYWDDRDREHVAQLSAKAQLRYLRSGN